MHIKTSARSLLLQYGEPLKTYLRGLRDVRNLGQVVFLVLVLLVSWSGAQSIQTNYKLQREVDRLRQENAIAELQNSTQELQNTYYKTSQYRELAARQNFGLAAPGETVLLVPKNVALAHTVAQADTKTKTPPATRKPFWQKNFEAWVDFFLHRQNDV